MAATVTGILLTGNHASRPTSGVSAGTLYSCTTHSLVYQTSDTGSTWATWATLGTGTTTTTVATDPIWDAAGDLAVGSGADTAAKLVKGSAGGTLAMVNGAVAWNAGTSNPTAAANDRYFRTDISMEFYYNGTRWLCTCPHFSTPASIDPNGEFPITTNGAVIYNGAMIGVDFDIWIEKWYVSTNVITTNDGTKFWTNTLRDAAGTTIGSFATNADTAGTKTNHETTINALLGTTSPNGLWTEISCVKTSTPGVMYIESSVKWRYVAS